jgi:hypothetical protein
MKTGLKAQRGVSLPALLVFGIIAVFLAAGAAKILPPYFEYRAIREEFKVMVEPPDIKEAKDHDIREAYNKQAEVSSSLNAITATDIDISRDGGKVTLSADYTVKIPLFANATLLLEFKPSATSR